MDDAYIRPRHTRYNTTQRKRKRKERDMVPLFKILFRQTVICGVILGIIVITKNVNTPITNFAMGKLKNALTYNIEPKAAYSELNSFISKVRNTKNDDKGDLSDTTKEESIDPGGGSIDYSAYRTPEGDDKTQNLVGGVSYNSDGNESLSSEEYQENHDTSGDDGQIGSEDSEDSVDNEDSKDSKVSESNKDNKDSEENRENPWQFPVDGIISSPFGERKHPLKKTIENHKGIDIDAKQGTPIKAALDGQIIEAGNEQTFGKYIKIQHSDNLITLYGHCSVLLVKKGQIVRAGDTIAKVGSTGASSGPHLHFEVREDGKQVNPLQFVKPVQE